MKAETAITLATLLGKEGGRDIGGVKGIRGRNNYNMPVFMIF